MPQRRGFSMRATPSLRAQEDLNEPSEPGADRIHSAVLGAQRPRGATSGCPRSGDGDVGIAFRRCGSDRGNYEGDREHHKACARPAYGGAPEGLRPGHQILPWRSVTAQ